MAVVKHQVPSSPVQVKIQVLVNVKDKIQLQSTLKSEDIQSHNLKSRDPDENFSDAKATSRS